MAGLLVDDNFVNILVEKTEEFIKGPKEGLTKKRKTQRTNIKKTKQNLLI